MSTAPRGPLRPLPRPRSRSRPSAPTTATRSSTRTPGSPTPRIPRSSPTWRPRTRYTEALTARARRPAFRPCSTRSRRAPRRPTCRCRCARATGGGTRAPWRASSTPSAAAAWCATARSRPPMPEDGKPLDGEEVLLDGNVLAEGKAFFSLGALSVSPDGKRLAYSTDFAGDERYTLRIKDLATGETLADEVPNTSLRLRLVARRVGPVLRHGRRRVAAVPGLAAHRRDADGGRRGGVRGERREVLARRRHLPRREVADDRHLVQADQRGVAARRGHPGRRVLRRRAAPPGRGVRRRGRRRPAAHPAQRRRGELRARLGAAARSRATPPRGRRSSRTGPTPGCCRSTRSSPTWCCTTGATG